MLLVLLLMRLLLVVRLLLLLIAPVLLLRSSAIAIIALVSLPIVDMLHLYLAASQVDINSTFIRLSMILQPKLLTDLFDSWFDLLDVPGAVVALADNNMQMRLAPASRSLDSLLEDILRFLYVQAV